MMYTLKRCRCRTTVHRLHNVMTIRNYDVVFRVGFVHVRGVFGSAEVNREFETSLDLDSLLALHSSSSYFIPRTLYFYVRHLGSTEREKIERQPPADSRSGEPRSRRVLLVTMINPLYETPKCSHEESAARRRNVERVDGRNASGREPGWTGAQDFISQ